MLTGELPFRGDTPVAVILQHIQADPPSIVDRVPYLPTAVESIINRALAKRPEERFMTAGAMAEELLRIKQ